jgi:hypothetical protein
MVCPFIFDFVYGIFLFTSGTNLGIFLCLQPSTIPLHIISRQGRERYRQGCGEWLKDVYDTLAQLTDLPILNEINSASLSQSQGEVEEEIVEVEKEIVTDVKKIFGGSGR